MAVRFWTLYAVILFIYFNPNSYVDLVLDLARYATQLPREYQSKVFCAKNHL